MLDKTYRPAEVESPHLRRVGGERRVRAATATAPRRPTASCCRRPTSPAACTWATRSTTRSRTRWSGSTACAATTCSGSPAPTMPASPPRWWSSASWRPPAATRAGASSGREAFVAKVWEWKAQSGGTIARQMRRLGDSPDWSRERFTMDEGLSRAVIRAFVGLHKAGLIYRDKRLVNWDVQLQTAVSDLEVQQTEVDGHLWHLRYPIEGGDGEFITVATTRPETMLGDTGVAVHPDDERYRHLHGRHAHPAAGRPAASRSSPTSIPIPRRAPARSRSPRPTTSTISRSAAGTGSRRSRSWTSMGRVNANAPEPYRGLDRFEARRRVVADLEALGLLDKVEQPPPHGAARRPLRHAARAVPDRPVVLRRQDPGAGRRSPRSRTGAPGSCRGSGRTPTSSGCATSSPGASRASSGGATRSRPGTGRTARSSSRRARPRPQPPRPARTTATTVDAAPRRGRARHLVLLGPVAVLDPGLARAARPSCARFYPTTVLVTGFDIIFFWVARMMMLGLHFMGEVPFKDVYIHGLVRDERGSQDVQDQGQRDRPAGADRRLRRRRAAPGAARLDRAGPRRQVRRRAGSRATATSSPSSGTPPASSQMNEARARPGLRPAPPAAQPLNRWIVGETPQDGRRGHRRRSRPTASTTRRWASTTSSGTPSATGMSSWPSPCCSARTRPRRRRPAPRPPGRWRRRCICCIRSPPSSPRSCGSSCSASPAAC